MDRAALVGPLLFLVIVVLLIWFVVALGKDWRR